MKIPVLFVLTPLVYFSSACAAETGGQEAEELEDLRAGLAVLADSTPEHLVAGRRTFVAACASCHGPAAGGAISGPPLVHTYYRPNHHADIAFLLAIQKGVRAHHWRFGDMPAVTGVDQEEAEQVVAYIRYLQQGMGIQ